MGEENGVWSTAVRLPATFFEQRRKFHSDTEDGDDDDGHDTENYRKRKRSAANEASLAAQISDDVSGLFFLPCFLPLSIFTLCCIQLAQRYSNNFPICFNES